MIGAISALALTAGMLILVLHLMRRWSDRVAVSQRGVALELLQRISVGPRQGVALLRVGDRVLVVSMVENGIELLTELKGEDLQAALSAPEPQVERLPVPARRLLRVAGLSVSLLFMLLLPSMAAAQTVDGTADQSVATGQGPAIVAPQFDVQMGDGEDGLHLSGTVGIVVFMGALTLIPALFLLATSFTRILIVLHFLRSALGTPTAPPTQLLIVIAVVLTGMVMGPVLEQANTTALQPYLNGEIPQDSAYKAAIVPFRRFMLANSEMNELATFAELSGSADAETIDDIPTLTVMSSFITSELKTAFQMGFVIYLPFVVLDLIVAAVLMSMGMFMLPPVMVSLPFKLMLFVLADGWTLIVRNLVTSFNV